RGARIPQGRSGSRIEQNHKESLVPFTNAVIIDGDIECLDGLVWVKKQGAIDTPEVQGGSGGAVRRRVADLGRAGCATRSPHRNRCQPRVLVDTKAGSIELETAWASRGKIVVDDAHGRVRSAQ